MDWIDIIVWYKVWINHYLLSNYFIRGAVSNLTKDEDNHQFYLR